MAAWRRLGTTNSSSVTVLRASIQWHTMTRTAVHRLPVQALCPASLLPRPRLATGKGSHRIEQGLRPTCSPCRSCIHRLHRPPTLHYTDQTTHQVRVHMKWTLVRSHSWRRSPRVPRKRPVPAEGRTKPSMCARYQAADRHSHASSISTDISAHTLAQGLTNARHQVAASHLPEALIFRAMRSFTRASSHTHARRVARRLLAPMHSPGICATTQAMEGALYASKQTNFCPPSTKLRTSLSKRSTCPSSDATLASRDTSSDTRHCRYITMYKYRPFRLHTPSAPCSLLCSACIIFP